MADLDTMVDVILEVASSPASKASANIAGLTRMRMGY